MRHLDEGTIHGWLDGALSSEEAARVEVHVAGCPACADAVAEARGLIAASSRILTALDDVPNIKSARGAKSAKGARPFLVTWLVRERIAAVIALVVAGGALAVAVSRDAPKQVHVASVPETVPALEVAVSDSAAPPPVAPEMPKDGQARGRVSGRGASPAQLPERDLAAVRRPDPAPPSQPLHVGEAVTTQAVAGAPARTDDTVRSVVLAQAQREEAQERLAEGKSSISQKVAGALPRRQAADASTRFAEPRAAAAPGYAGALNAAAAAGNQRLVQEERMMEQGREVVRRIYRVDGILVTLDERAPAALDEMMRSRVEERAAPTAAAVPAPAAPAAPPDSAKESTNTIRWTDARGAELTLSGPASPARLERIRKLLGL